MLLVRWFGLRPGILPPLALYLFCVDLVPGRDLVGRRRQPAAAPDRAVLGAPAHVSYLRTGRLRHAWFTVAWLLGGLLFYEKTVLVLGAIAIVSLAYFATGGLRGAGPQPCGSGYRPGVVLYVVVGASYLLDLLPHALNFEPGQAGHGGLPDVSPTWSSTSTCPALVGGPLKWTAFDQFPLPATGTLADRRAAPRWSALLVREIRRTRQRSLRAWLAAGVLPRLQHRAGGGRPGVVRRCPDRPRLPLPGRARRRHRVALALRDHADPRRDRAGRGRPAPAAFLDRPRRVAAAVVVVRRCWRRCRATQYIDHWNETMPAKPYFAQPDRADRGQPPPAAR